MRIEKAQRLPVIAHDHANDTMVHRIAGSDSVDVDLGLSEGVRYARQCAGPVVQKDCQLFCNLHKSIASSTVRVPSSFHRITIIDSIYNRQSEIKSSIRSEPRIFQPLGRRVPAFPPPLRYYSCSIIVVDSRAAMCELLTHTYDFLESK